eukprot:753731-Hanusia_phi.AAC.1
MLPAMLGLYCFLPPLLLPPVRDSSPRLPASSAFRVSFPPLAPSHIYLPKSSLLWSGLELGSKRTVSCRGQGDNRFDAWFERSEKKMDQLERASIAGPDFLAEADAVRVKPGDRILKF